MGGMQTEVGSITAEVVDQPCRPQGLDRWIQNVPSTIKSTPVDTFAPMALLRDLVDVACKSKTGTSLSLDDVIAATKEASLDLFRSSEEQQLAAALAASLGDAATSSHVDSVAFSRVEPQRNAEELRLAAVLAASAAEFSMDPANAGLRSSEDDVLVASRAEQENAEASDLHAALLLSQAPSGQFGLEAPIEVINSDSDAEIVAPRITAPEPKRARVKESVPALA